MVIAAAIVSVLCLLLQDDSVPADSPVQDLPDEDYSDQAQVQHCEILQTQCPRLFGLFYSTFLFSMLFPTIVALMVSWSLHPITRWSAPLD